MNEVERPNYYAVIPANVRYDESLKPNEKLLYGEITALSNKTGICYATNKYFADLYLVEVETISRWIKNLKKRGYIDTEMIYKKDTKEIEKRVIKIFGIPIDKKINTYCLNSQGGIDKKVKENNTSINIKEIYKEKILFGEFKRIKLTENEYENLCKKYTKDFIDLQIKYLDEYVESNNNKNKYTNYNLVIQKSIRENWFKLDITQKTAKEEKEFLN